MRPQGHERYSVMVKARNQVKVFSQDESTEECQVEQPIRAVSAHGKTAVYWVEYQTLDIFFHEIEYLTTSLHTEEKADKTIDSPEVFDLGLVNDDDELHVEKVAKFLADVKPEAETPVVHLFVNWIHEADLLESDYGMVAATVANVAKSLDKLKANGWKLFHGTSDEENGKIAFFLATHDSVKTEAEAEKQLRKLKLAASVEVRCEPLGEVDEVEAERVAPAKRTAKQKVTYTQGGKPVSA